MPELSRFASRLLPARPDLAACGLEGRVMAPRYAEGERRSVTAPLLDLAATPDRNAERATQLLHGEVFTVYDEADGFAWGQSAADHYVGYVDASGLGPSLPDEGRTITALLAHVYPAPDIKRRPRAALPFGARVAVAAEEGGFTRLADGGFLSCAALVPRSDDFVTAAMRFLGAPYLWGGRSVLGLDCSALVQLALAAVGTAAPRDSDMQAALVGEALPPDAAPEPGDLLFWKGHVGIVAGEDTLLHANARAMAVTREPLGPAIARIEVEGGGPVIAQRRGADRQPAWPPCTVPAPCTAPVP